MSVELEGHLRIGRETLNKISQLNLGEQPVCFHFTVPPGANGEQFGYGIEATYWPALVRRAAELGFDASLDGSGGEFGFEIWEIVDPSFTWLEERIPQMMGLAEELGHQFAGWTFEPADRVPLCAAPELTVFNAATDEGRAKINELIEQVQFDQGSEE